MLISSPEKIEKITTKLSQLPELRRVSITSEGNLLIERMERKLLIQNYVLLSPLGSYAKLNGRAFHPAVDDPLPIGLITEGRLLLNRSDSMKSSISTKHPPTADETFLMLSLMPRFCELIFANGNMGTPLAILKEEKSLIQLVGLAATLIQPLDAVLTEFLLMSVKGEVF